MDTRGGKRKPNDEPKTVDDETKVVHETLTAQNLDLDVADPIKSEVFDGLTSKRAKALDEKIETVVMEEANIVAKVSEANLTTAQVAEAPLDVVELAAVAAVGPTRKGRPRLAAAARFVTAKAEPPLPPFPSMEGIIPTDPAHFNDCMFHLLYFKARTNSFSVPRDELPKLHAFLQHLKKEYKLYMSQAGEDQATPAASASSVLTAQQVAVLESLHVPVTSRGDEHWMRFFNLLEEWKEEHGHVLVPRLCEVPGLGDWVTDQRRQYKAWKQGQPTQLTEFRRNQLEAIDFAWSVRDRPEWDQRFKELQEYKEKYGDCKVPQHYRENRSLGKWVAKQREQYKLLQKDKHSFLTPFRLEQLNELGFSWQVRTATSMDDDEDNLAETVPVPTTVKTELAGDAIQTTVLGTIKLEDTEGSKPADETERNSTEIPGDMISMEI